MDGEKMQRELEMLENTYDTFWFSFFHNTFSSINVKMQLKMNLQM